MAQHSVARAKEKVEEKEQAIVALARSERRMETILAAAVDKVKDEEVEEVVKAEVEVEAEAEDMVEETDKEEADAKVVVETAVERGGGVSEWLRFFFGVEGCGGHPGAAMQGSSTLGLLDITMVWANPPVFSKPPKLVKTDIMRINKTPPFFRS